jgi:hypothetical protein
MPGHDHSQSIGRGIPKSAMESGVLTDPLKAKEPLVVLGKKDLWVGMRVAICRDGEVGHPLITDSTGEVYLFDVLETDHLFPRVRLNLVPEPHLRASSVKITREEYQAEKTRLDEKLSMQDKANGGSEFHGLRFVPVDACPQAMASYGTVYAAFVNGEPVRDKDHFAVEVTIDAHGKRTVNGGNYNLPIDKSPLPKDAVLVPFRKADGVRNAWMLPLIAPDGTSIASVVGGYYRTRREAREIFSEEKARIERINAQTGFDYRVGQPVRIDTRLLDEQF